MDSKNKIVKIISSKFANGLADKHLLGKEYAVYIFSLFQSRKLKYGIKLEASKMTRHFDVSKILPLPPRRGTRFEITYKTYQRYAHSFGESHLSYNSLLMQLSNIKSITSAQKSYWKNKHVYSCVYEFEEAPIVIFLIFDFDDDEKAQSGLLSLYLKPILKTIEDKIHKDCIFNRSYLNILCKIIDKKNFPSVHKSIKELRKEYQYEDYLKRIFYDFFIDNLEMYEKQLSNSHKNTLLEIMKEFEKNERNLFIIHKYRDHYSHQYNVYLLGIAFLNLLETKLNLDIVGDFNRAYTPQKNTKYGNILDTGLIWFLAAFFHDIAYPAEKCEQWLTNFIIQYIYPTPELPKKQRSGVKLLNVITDNDYNHCLDDLSEYYRELNTKNPNDPINYSTLAEREYIKRGSEIRYQILNQTDKQMDHGILSAMMLLHRFRNEKKILKYIFPAAAAISIHNYQWINRELINEPCESCDKEDCCICTNWKETYDNYFDKWQKKVNKNQNPDNITPFRYISYEKDPICFLLILSDLLNDWGRYNVESIDQAFDPFFNPCQMAGIYTENSKKDLKIIFDLKIVTPTDPESDEKIRKFFRYKMQEIVKVFSRLKFEATDVVIRMSSKFIKTSTFSMKSFK